MRNIVGIVQARLGSKRLANKMLLHFNGYPVIEWVYKRLLKSKLLDAILFAIPESPDNNILEYYLKNLGAEVHRGSENDLVDRYYNAAIECKAEHIVRICADNPLVTATEIDYLIYKYKYYNCDYAYNHIPLKNNWPDGLGGEICHIDLLKEIYKKTKIKEHREHIFNYIWDNSNYYNIKTFNAPQMLGHPNLKFDIDDIRDYENLISLPYCINMTSEEIVNLALKK